MKRVMRKTKTGFKNPKNQEVLEARWKRFCRQFEEYENEHIAEMTLDAFLDMYQKAKTDRTWQLRYRTVCLLFELHRLRPSFVGEITFD